MTTYHQMKMKVLGMYFGFPVCCIRQFVAEFDNVLTGAETPDRRPPTWMGTEEAKAGHWPWTGTGFIPCSDCAPVARADFAKFVCERITPGRVCSFPFPDAPVGKDAVEGLMKELGFDG